MVSPRRRRLMLYGSTIISLAFAIHVVFNQKVESMVQPLPGTTTHHIDNIDTFKPAQSGSQAAAAVPGHGNGEKRHAEEPHRIEEPVVGKASSTTATPSTAPTVTTTDAAQSTVAPSSAPTSAPSSAPTQLVTAEAKGEEKEEELEQLPPMECLKETRSCVV